MGLLKKIFKFLNGEGHKTPDIQYAQNCIFSSITNAYCYKHHKECYTWTANTATIIGKGLT